MRFSKTVSVGNQSDLKLIDFLEYLGEDPDAKVILSYLEEFGEGKRFQQPGKTDDRLEVRGERGRSTSNRLPHGGMAGSHLVWDPQFGPCVMFGLGGIFSEIFHDVVFRVAPLERRDAFDMMEEIRSKKILDSVRGMPPANKDELADILIRVGEIGLKDGRIQEIDINPLILAAGRPIAVNALVILNSHSS